MTSLDTGMAVPKKIGKVRLWIAAIAFIAYMVAFFDRANVTVLIANRSFTDAFGITADKSTQGLLLSVFMLFYGVTCFFAGPVVQRFGARKALGYGLLSWAIFTAIMGSVSSVVILLACRALLGIGEAVLGPGVSKLVQTWFPVRERAKVNGAWFIGLLMSQIIAPPMITGLVSAFGWRESFYFLAVIGIIPVIVAFLFVYDIPARHPRISREEVDYISGGVAEKPATSTRPAGSFSFVKESNFWLVAILYALSTGIGWGVMGWLPTYFKAVLGFSFARMGIMAALPFLVGAASVVVFTPMMDKFNSRAPFAVIAFAGFGICLFAAMKVSSQTSAVIIFCVANGFFMPNVPSLFTILQNTIKSTEVANATGIFNGIAYIVASAFPYLMGALYKSTGDLKNGFYLLLVLTVLAIIMGIPLMKRRL